MTVNGKGIGKIRSKVRMEQDMGFIPPKPPRKKKVYCAFCGIERLGGYPCNCRFEAQRMDESMRATIPAIQIQHQPPDDLESMNPENCTKFDANEFGNCKNLSWCFRVFGIQLSCQQTRKPTDEVIKEEHRRLEIPDGTM